MENKAYLELVNWQFLKLMQALDDEIMISPNNGKGSLAAAYMERYQDKWVMLQARLIDASSRNFDRYARLKMDEKTIIQFTSDEEWQLVIRLLVKINLRLKAALKTTEDPNDIIDLTFEQQSFDRLLASLK